MIKFIYFGFKYHNKPTNKVLEGFEMYVFFVKFSQNLTFKKEEGSVN